MYECTLDGTRVRATGESGGVRSLGLLSLGPVQWCLVNSIGGSNYTFFDVAQGLVLITETLLLDRFCLVVS